MKRVVVGISDMQVSKNPDDLLITYSLGSCIGVAVWDREAKVGGLLHYMLPDAGLDKARAQLKPAMFGSTGIPLLFKEAYKLGASKNSMTVVVVGGGQIMDATGVFNIGKRNYAILQKLFQKNSVNIDKQDIGGTVNRTISLEVGTGITRLKISGKEEFLL